jgi:hypothetical protein
MSTTVITSAPGWSAALTPQSTDEAWKIATAIAKSSLVPKQYQGQPGDIIIAASMGARLGLDPFSAMQGIAVVNGRPTLWGDAMLAVCQARPDWRGQTVAWSGDDKLTCTVTVRRQVGQSVDEYSGVFSPDDAKKAGLWTKQGPWSQYPRRMLELRARAFALRGAFADALLGFHAKEEMEDAPIDVTASATVRDEAPKGRKIKQVDASPAPVAQAPVVDEPTTQATTAGPSEASDGSVGEVATGETVSEPTLDQVRAAVNRAASAVGGARKIIEAIERVTGYSVMKADDIEPEHRAQAIKIADEFAGV